MQNTLNYCCDRLLHTSTHVCNNLSHEINSVAISKQKANKWDHGTKKKKFLHMFMSQNTWICLQKRKKKYLDNLITPGTFLSIA